jgi:hypothetical protein
MRHELQSKPEANILPPYNSPRTLGIVLLQGPRRGVLLMIEVPLYHTKFAMREVPLFLMSEVPLFLMSEVPLYPGRCCNASRRPGSRSWSRRSLSSPRLSLSSR